MSSIMRETLQEHVKNPVFISESLNTFLGLSRFKDVVVRNHIHPDVLAAKPSSRQKRHFKTL